MKVGKDLQYFIEEIENIFHVIHITELEGVDIAAYKLKNIEHQWYDMWEQLRGVDIESALREDFSRAFLYLFFP